MPKRKRRSVGGGGRGRTSKRLKLAPKPAKEIEEGISSTSTVKWDPFSVFPKEIYLKIFNKLDNPADKLNFMNAHVRWYELFKAERVKFLFGKVFEDLPLDERTWSKRNKKWKRKTDKNLLGLRLICHDWDEAIKDYYQLHPDHFKFVFCEDKWATDWNHMVEQYANGYRIGAHSIGRGWRSERDLETDLSKFQRSHPPSKKKNPFLTRKITICLVSKSSAEEDDQLRTLCGQIHYLLKTYGEHIWHFAYSSGWGLGPDMYERILQWLRLMPELRTLRMEFGSGTGASNCDPLGRIHMMNSPKMKKLQNIHVAGSSYYAFNKLLEGAKALKKVEVGFRKLQGFQFPRSLTELALSAGRYEEIIYLKTLKQFPLLRKLIININVTDELNLDYSAIWNTIEKNFPALENLHLDLPFTYRNNVQYKMMKQSLNCKLQLSKLKKLSLGLPSYCCLDFLQEIKTLQELKIDLILFDGDFDDLLRTERIQFNRDYATMWESNIWQVFPNLRKLSILDPGEPGTGKREVHHFYQKGAKGEQMYNQIIIPNYN